jgi:predicted TIM-barrel fold metal-dependent hydrolase
VREVQQRFLARGRGPAPDNVLKHFNVFVTTEISDDIEYIVRHAGDENLLLGTDYGHADISSAMNAIEDFKRMDSLSDETKRRILYENPKRLYSI